MTSGPHFFIRVLQSAIHHVWTVLFFLSGLAVASLANHFWADLAACGLRVKALLLDGMHFLSAL